MEELEMGESDGAVSVVDDATYCFQRHSGKCNHMRGVH